MLQGHSTGVQGEGRSGMCREGACYRGTAQGRERGGHRHIHRRRARPRGTALAGPQGLGFHGCPGFRQGRFWGQGHETGTIGATALCELEGHGELIHVGCRCSQHRGSLLHCCSAAQPLNPHTNCASSPRCPLPLWLHPPPSAPPPQMQDILLLIFAGATAYFATLSMISVFALDDSVRRRLW